MRRGPRWYILDDDRQTVEVDTMHDWARWAAEQPPGALQVGHDLIAGVRISTVFLGLDHNHYSGRPLLFETMTFDDYGTCQVARYSTWREAVEGHEREAERIASAKTVYRT